MLKNLRNLIVGTLGLSLIALVVVPWAAHNFNSRFPRWEDYQQTQAPAQGDFTIVTSQVAVTTGEAPVMGLGVAETTPEAALSLQSSCKEERISDNEKFTLLPGGRIIGGSFRFEDQRYPFQGGAIRLIENLSSAPIEVTMETGGVLYFEAKCVPDGTYDVYTVTDEGLSIRTNQVWISSEK